MRDLSLGVFSHQHNHQGQQQTDADKHSYQGFRGTLCHVGGTSVTFEGERILPGINRKCPFCPQVVHLSPLTPLPDCVSLDFLRSVGLLYSPSDPKEVKHASREADLEIERAQAACQEAHPKRRFKI